MKENNHLTILDFTEGKQEVFEYLCLSLVSGIMETGVLTFGYMHYDALTGLFFVLAYQVGCLFKKPLQISLRMAVLFLLLSLLLFLSGLANRIVLFMAISLMCGGMQCIRDHSLPTILPVSESVKRSIRVFGFVLGIFVGFINNNAVFGFVVILTILLALPIVMRNKQAIPILKQNATLRLFSKGWVMLFHQTHYFAYAYVLLIYFLHSNTISSSFDGISAALWFLLGWGTYINGKWLLNDILKLSNFKAIIYGHLLVGICLILMIDFYSHPYIYGSLWVIGGFGGGSVYALKKFLKDFSADSEIDVELWENWGHVAGIALTVLSLFFFPKSTLLPYYIAVTAVFFTLVSFLIVGNASILGRK